MGAARATGRRLARGALALEDGLVLAATGPVDRESPHGRVQPDAILAEDNAMGIYNLPQSPLRVLTEYEVRRPRALDGRHAHPSAGFNGVRPADWRRWPRYQRSVWRRFDAVQVFTQRDAGTLRTIAPSLATGFTSIPSPSSPPEELRGRDPSTVVFLGNYTHPPNVDAALWLGREIMPHLRRLHPGPRLVLAGVHAPEAVRALAGPDIAFLGAVPDAEALMRASAVVLAPVRIGGGMRMKVLHAMASPSPSSPRRAAPRGWRWTGGFRRCGRTTRTALPG